MGTSEGRGHSGWKKRYSGDHTGEVGISRPQWHRRRAYRDMLEKWVVGYLGLDTSRLEKLAWARPSEP